MAGHEKLAVGGEVPVKPDQVKLSLEDLLLDVDVEIVYGSAPVGICVEGGALKGVIIANKSGRQVVLGKMIVDTTETATVLRLAGAEFEDVLTKAALFDRTLEYLGVASTHETVLSVPQSLDIAGDQVALHRGYRRADNHVLVECRFQLPVGDFGPEDVMQREIEARHRTMRLATHLARSVSTFANAFLAATSYELAGPSTSRMKGLTPSWAAGLPPLLVEDPKVPRELPWSALAGPIRGLWCLNEALRGERHWVENFRDPVAACRLGEAFARSALAQEQAVIADRAHTATVPFGTATEEELEVREPVSPQPGRPYETQRIEPSAIPVSQVVDVLVVGGGTSGATAAATAAHEGARTLLLEMNPGLGGTGTIGGVHSYWFGRRLAFAAKVTERVREIEDQLGHPTDGRRWSIEAKMYALLRDVLTSGAEILFPAIAIGTIIRGGDEVCGVVVATRKGLRAILAQVVIDGTGDGDVAAFAGAEHVKGSVMDHIVMWTAMAQFVTPGRTTNHFTEQVDVTNVEDCTRGLLAGRRRGPGRGPAPDTHDHGVYLAPRESRHILGDRLLTTTDQLRQRCWPDVVNIHYSNHDMKGKTCSQWHQTGLIPPNLEMEIPYAALLPKGLDNLLIAGKAFSTNHDGLAALRMQTDLENLGGVVALAAVEAVREGKRAREIDVHSLQQRLVAEGILPEAVLTRTLRPRRYSDSELKALVVAMIADKPLLAYQDMAMFEVFRETIPLVEVCTAGQRVVPFLVEALETAAPDRRVLVAQALALLGSNAGVAILVAAAEQMLAGETVPRRAAGIRHANVPPDQGAAAEVVYLNYSLGMARDRRSLGIWQRIADILQPRAEHFYERDLGTFCYVDSVCFGAERLGDREAIPILNRLHSYPALRDQVSRKGFQPDHILHRRAMLELAIGKGLARCGSPQGFSILIAYLDDRRAMLAEQAHANLARITEEDHGKDSARWAAWLEDQKDSLQPIPLLDDLDHLYDKDILVT